MEDGDDDPPRLSPETLAALQEVLAEQAERPAVQERDGVAYLEPDWGLAQFWYTTATSALVAEEAFDRAGGGAIACLCTPSVFRALQTMTQSQAYLFEFDHRFDIFGDKFVHFDLYKSPEEQFPASLKGKFSVLVADPPHLNREAVNALAVHGRWLSLRGAEGPAKSADLILLTGSVLEEDVRKVLRARRNVWKPEHQCPIQNPFSCYTNYPSSRFGGLASG
eukprot:RCo004165